MNKENIRQKGNFVMPRVLRASIAMALVLVLMVPVLPAKERRGAEVIVLKRDGTAVSGELLAVKGTDLLIRDGSQGVTIGFADVKTVKVIKKSKFLKGAGIGFIIGAIPAAVLGAGTGQEHPGFFGWTPEQGAVLGGLVFGALGALIGGLAGGLSGIDKNISIENSSPITLAEAASKLRRYARDRG